MKDASTLGESSKISKDAELSEEKSCLKDSIDIPAIEAVEEGTATEQVSETKTEKKYSFLRPKFGNRIVRTVIACLVTAIIYRYFLSDRNPCFALIGAVYGMGSQFQEGFHNGFNRFVGTFIGGLVVIPSYWLYYTAPFGVPSELYMCLGLFFVMYINFILGANNAIQPGTVIYFVVMFTQPEAGYVSYTIARIIDTGIGVLISLGLTMMRPTMIDREKGVELLTFFEALSESFKAWRYANKSGSLPQLDEKGRAAKREERKARYIERHSY